MESVMQIVVGVAVCVGAIGLAGMAVSAGVWMTVEAIKSVRGLLR